MALPIIPNVALGRIVEFCQLAKDQPSGFASARLRWILLKSAGLEPDTTLRDYDTVAAILAAANDESGFGAYARLTVAPANISIPDPDTPDQASVDITVDPSWNPVAPQEQVGAIILAFNPDGADTLLTPLFIDAVGVLSGTGGVSTPLTYQIASGPPAGFVLVNQA